MIKTKKIIFEAAIKLFSEKGFHKSTMDDIAEAAKVAKGTLYYHFSSKEDIFKFIIDEGIRLIEEETEDKVIYIDDPAIRIRKVLILQIELMNKYSGFFKAILSQLWGNEDQQQQIKKIIERYLKMLEKYIREGIDPNKTDDKTLEVITLNLFGIMTSSLIYKSVNKVQNQQDSIDIMIDLLLNGLKGFGFNAS